MKRYVFTIVYMLIVLSLVAQTRRQSSGAPANVVAVDLGLPSGTRWASCNVGAEKPEDYGEQYAWGEVNIKNNYSWESYIHCDGSSSTLHDIGTNISDTNYDAAHIKWGGGWVMPDNNQINELYKYCSPVQTTQNGVNGILFTGLNGNTIFLPDCEYWSSDLQTIVPETAYYWGVVTLSKGRVSKSKSRCDGSFIRPIQVPPCITITPENGEIRFGVVKIGTEKTKELTVTNTNDKTVTVTMDGCTKSWSNFDVSNNQEEVTLTPGDSKVYIVTAHGQAAGLEVSQKLFVKCNAIDEDVVVYLSSFGDDDEPLIDVSSLTMPVGDNASVKAHVSLNYDVEVDDYSIVSYSSPGGPGVSGGPIDRHDPSSYDNSIDFIITALKSGVAHITFTDHLTNKTAILTITVTDESQDDEDVACLVVWHKDGSKVLFNLSDKPKITHVEEKVVINAASTVEYDFQSVRKMTYNRRGDVDDEIEDLFVNNEKPFTSSGETITFLPAEKDLHVRVISLNGIVIKDFVVKKGETSTVSLNSFSTNIYLIVVNGVTYKIAL